MSEYGIGGQEKPQEASEAISLLSKNKTLLANKFTDEQAPMPEVVEGLTNMDQVFKHFEPNVEVEFETEDGGSESETLHFSTVGDFGKKGITKQSAFLNDLQAKQDEYMEFAKVLKSNKQLLKLLKDPAAKQAYLASLKSMIADLEDSNT